MRTGRALIIPKYQFTNAFRAKEAAAEAKAEADGEELEETKREGETGEKWDEDSLNLEERRWVRT